MSKKCKAESKQRRLAKKRAKKATQKAQYAAWKLSGQNSKSKRSKLRAKRLRKKTVNNVKHAKGPCGNIGCARCNPIPQNLAPQVHLTMQ